MGLTRTNKDMGKAIDYLAQRYKDASVPAQVLFYCAPPVLAAFFLVGGQWYLFKGLPAAAAANRAASAQNRGDIVNANHRIDLADQDRQHLAKALNGMAKILKEIRDDQREEIRRARHSVSDYWNKRPKGRKK